MQFIKWKTAPVFGTCNPALDGNGKRTLTYRRPVEPRRPVKERLDKRVDVARIRNPETDPELEYLRAQVDWQGKEARHYRERIDRWEINRQY